MPTKPASRTSAWLKTSLQNLKEPELQLVVSPTDGHNSELGVCKQLDEDTDSMLSVNVSRDSTTLVIEGLSCGKIETHWHATSSSRWSASYGVRSFRYVSTTSDSCPSLHKFRTCSTPVPN